MSGSCRKKGIQPKKGHLSHLSEHNLMKKQTNIILCVLMSLTIPHCPSLTVTICIVCNNTSSYVLEVSVSGVRCTKFRQLSPGGPDLCRAHGCRGGRLGASDQGEEELALK